MNRCQVAFSVFALTLAGCASLPPAQPPPAPVMTFSPSGTPGGVDAPGLGPYPPSWTLPDPAITPGALQPGVTLKDLCPRVSPALEAQRPSYGAKRVVYAQYGIVHHAPGVFEVDHLVPIELGGLAGAPPTHVTENLWPEPNDKPDPAMLAKYHLRASYVHNSKDILEDVLHQKVCAGTVPLATAQKAFEQDWRAAYVKYIGTPP